MNIQAHIQNLGEVACTLLQVYPDGDARVCYQGRDFIVSEWIRTALPKVKLVSHVVTLPRAGRARTTATRFACLRAEPVAVLRSRRALRRALLIGA